MFHVEHCTGGFFFCLGKKDAGVIFSDAQGKYIINMKKVPNGTFFRRKNRASAARLMYGDDGARRHIIVLSDDFRIHARAF